MRNRETNTTNSNYNMKGYKYNRIAHTIITPTSTCKMDEQAQHNAIDLSARDTGLSALFCEGPPIKLIQPKWLRVTDTDRSTINALNKGAETVNTSTLKLQSTAAATTQGQTTDPTAGRHPGDFPAIQQNRAHSSPLKRPAASTGGRKSKASKAELEKKIAKLERMVKRSK